MENKIESLEDEMIELRHEVDHAVQDIQNLQTENSDLQDREEEQAMAIIELKKENKRSSTYQQHVTSPVTRGKRYKSEGKYSDSYCRKLKRDRTESCGRSLSGYIPMMVTVVNIKSGEEDSPNSELTQILGQSGSIHEDTMNKVNMLYWYNVSVPIMKR